MAQTWPVILCSFLYMSVMDVEGGHSSVIFVFLALGVVVYLLRSSERKIPGLKSIPAVGKASYILSYIDAFQFRTQFHKKLRVGYEKFRTGLFKISSLNRWIVIVTGTKSIERLRKAEEHEASFASVANEPDASLYHIGHISAVSHPHIRVLTGNITQNLTFMVPAIKEEAMLALNSSIPSADNSTGWQDLEAVNLVVQVTSRVINRVVFGLLPSEGEKYTRLSKERALDVYGFKLPLLYSLLPKTIVAVIKAPRHPARQRRHLQQLTESFIRESKTPKPSGLEDGEQQRQNDLLSYILAEPSTAYIPVEDLASHLVDLSITASQTISMTFAHVLYHLAANPRFAAPMRKETESIISREGWSKTSLEHMRKIDSFMKESMRLSNISSISMIRKTLQPITLDDGTTIPPNVLIAAASLPRQLNSSIYPSPEVFDGFRFSKLHKLQFGALTASIFYPSSDTSSSPMTTTNTPSPFAAITTGADFLVWGYGRHACPGRFLSTTVLKVLLAYVVLHYDVRFEDGVRPDDVVVGTNLLPNPNARVMIRRR